MVFDEMNENVSYAAILNSEGNLVAYTDVDGTATFEADCDNTDYTVNYFGYEDKPFKLECPLTLSISITLQPDVISLKTINIVGTSAAAQASKPYQVSSIDKRTLKSLQSQTTVEALEQNGNAYIQRSQMGGGSPILRGFEANKVLLVVDGVRLNNAIYRSGHLQNAISVDQAVLENITTLYGPGSIIYGSDALGGVIHFQTRRPVFSTKNKPTFSGGYYARYASANNERSAHVDLNLSTNKLASLTSLTFSSFGDLKSGKKYNDKFPDFGKRTFYVNPETDEIIENKNPEEQIFTGYDQFDFLEKITYKIDDKKYLGLNIQYSTSSDIPRYDELIVVDENGRPETSEWYYGPQKRFLTALRFDNESSTKLFDRHQIQFSYQKINEDRHQRAFQNPDLISNLEEVDVYSANMDFYKKTGQNERQELSYGLEYRYNHVTSRANRFNRETGITTFDVFTRYPSDNSDMFDAGAYALYQYKSERLTGQVGGRFNWNKLHVQYDRNDFFDWPEFFYNGISQSTTALTWLAGLNYKIGANTHFRLFSGTGFRAPNVDDFAKIRVRANRSISIPNEDLAPEKTWNIEVGMQHEIGGQSAGYPKINIGITGFYTRITDAIIRQDFALPNGDSTYFYNGNDLQVQANVNASKGKIYGLSLQTHCSFTSALEFQGSVSWQRGRSTQEAIEQPLAHIPPLYGQATLAYRKPKWSTSIKTIFNGRKELADFAPSSSDNDDLATPDGSLAWAILNWYAEYKINRSIELRAGAENIFDLHYRTFSSGLSAPGRNIKLGIYGQF